MHPLNLTATALGSLVTVTSQEAFYLERYQRISSKLTSLKKTFCLLSSSLRFVSLALIFIMTMIETQIFVKRINRNISFSSLTFDYPCELNSSSLRGAMMMVRSITNLYFLMDIYVLYTNRNRSILPFLWYVKS